MKGKNKYLLAGLIGIIIVLTLGVSYAYFKGRVTGDEKSIIIKSKGVYLEYKGDVTLVNESIEPGWNITKTFSVENQGNNEEKYDIYIKDLINTFVTNGSLQYKITSTNGYNMTDFKEIPKSETTTDTVLAYSVSINSKEKQNYSITFKYDASDDDQSGDIGMNFSGSLGIKIGSEKPIALIDAILRDNPTVKEKVNFTVANVSNTTGTIFKTNKTEDNSNVYYYSGNTTNNWVKFGGFYWRIIRTNEDGSIRLLYSGTSHDTEEGYIGKSEYNTNNTDSMYVGYMYGTSGSLDNNRLNTNDSKIKTIIDTWYKNNLLNNYDKYISKSAIYCNDRSIGSGTYSSNGSTFYYGAYTRLYTNKTPSYKCGSNTSDGLFESTQSISDKFSASTTNGGNGKLTYPIALMTADEIVFAGGKSSTSLSSPYTWYYTNSKGTSITGSSYWWTMSSTSFSDSKAYVWDVVGSSLPGYLYYNDVTYTNAVRPTISLTSCVKVNGTGTSTDPYIVDYNDSTC